MLPLVILVDTFFGLTCKSPQPSLPPVISKNTCFGKFIFSPNLALPVNYLSQEKFANDNARVKINVKIPLGTYFSYVSKLCQKLTDPV